MVAEKQAALAAALADMCARKSARPAKIADDRPLIWAPQAQVKAAAAALAQFGIHGRRFPVYSADMNGTPIFVGYGYAYGEAAAQAEAVAA